MNLEAVENTLLKLLEILKLLKILKQNKNELETNVAE